MHGNFPQQFHIITDVSHVRECVANMYRNIESRSFGLSLIYFVVDHAENVIDKENSRSLCKTLFQVAAG